MTLRRFGRFTGPRIVWAGPTEDDEERLDWLDALHDDLWSRLEEMGWTRPDAIFRPHVSLLRKEGPGAVQTLRRPPLAWMPDRRSEAHTSALQSLMRISYAVCC